MGAPNRNHHKFFIKRSPIPWNIVTCCTQLSQRDHDETLRLHGGSQGVARRRVSLWILTVDLGATKCRQRLPSC